MARIGSDQSSSRSGAASAVVGAARSAPLERAVFAAGPVRNTVSALCMRERLLASNRRAGERVPVDRDGWPMELASEACYPSGYEVA